MLGLKKIMLQQKTAWSVILPLNGVSLYGYFAHDYCGRVYFRRKPFFEKKY